MPVFSIIIPIPLIVYTSRPREGGGQLQIYISTVLPSYSALLVVLFLSVDVIHLAMQAITVRMVYGAPATRPSYKGLSGLDLILLECIGVAPLWLATPHLRIPSLAM